MRRHSPLAAAAALALLLLAAAAPAIAAGTDPNAPADPNASAPVSSAPDANAPAPAAPPPVADANAPAPAAPAVESAPAASKPPARAVPKITRIVVDGNQRLTQDAVLHIMTCKEGDPYDADLLRRDFKKIWERGLLKDLSIESRDEQGGKAIVIHVQEKPIVNNVAYDESKVVSETQIEDALKERKATVEIGEPINYDSIKKAEEGIKAVLGQKGYLDAEVESELKEAGTPGSLDVHFKIKEGPRTRIRKIEFTGNNVFSDRRLRKTLKLTKEHGLFTKMSGKDTYHPIKLDQDMREVEDLYHNTGYIEVELRAPQVSVVEETKSEKPGKGRKWVHIVQPIVEGKQYKVGKIEVTGNTVFTADEIRRRIPLREGMILNNAALQAGLDSIEAAYGQKGYFYISTNRVIDRKPDGTGDVTVRISEDKPYKIDRIEFSGNTVTRDNVLRREMLVNENELLDIQRLRLGIRRINQLGYFEVQKEPVIKPVEGTDRVSVTIEGIEQRRSELQVGGGYSGLDGAFFTSSYQTRNFLGRGDLVTFNVQTGQLATRYVISFTEPYLLGRPNVLGFSIFRRTTDYSNYTTDGSGGSLSIGRRIGVFHSIGLSYMFEDTNYDPTVGASTFYRTNSIRPTYSFDSRNNFFRPSRGFYFVSGVELAGGPLGGDSHFVKPVIEGTRFMRAFKRTFWAFHAQAGYVSSLSGYSVPPYERFYLGGERSLRIFPTRSISPEGFFNVFHPGEIYFTKQECLDAPVGKGFHHYPPNPCTRGIIGGDKMILFNAEYVIPSSGPVDLVLFLDAGNAYTEVDRPSFATLKKDAGVEARFFLPMFGAPLRLIYGFNLDPAGGDKRRAFIFSIGTTF